MNTYISNIFSFVLIVIFGVSCSTNRTTDDGEGTNGKETGLEVYKAPASPRYQDASLTLADLPESLDTGDIQFNFTVENYELGIQTSDAATRGIANSGNGQHIHFIVNNGPYSAHYESSFTKNFKAGNYVILAFLSRSYHESVKTPSAFLVKTMTVGNPSQPMDVDPEGQHLFFSRPKGTYAGADAQKLMLDFFLYNTIISPDGNKVRATINGEEFTLDEWAPYYIEGLEKGDVTIKIELIDNAGNLIPGPFNVEERTVTLE